MANKRAQDKVQKVEQKAPQAVPQEQPKVSPEVERKVNAYISALSKLMHGKETKNHVYKMLQSGEPMVTIPRSAIEINRQAEEAFKRGGATPDLDTLFAGSQFLILDLIEIGNAGGFFQLDPQDPNVLGPLVQSTVQPYVEEGLKNGTIDPVELQNKIEPMLTDEQRAQGGLMAQEQGMSMEANQGTAMETYRRQGILDERGRNADMVAKAKIKQGQRAEQAAPQQQPQGQQGVLQNG